MQAYSNSGGKKWMLFCRKVSKNRLLPLPQDHQLTLQIMLSSWRSTTCTTFKYGRTLCLWLWPFLWAPVRAAGINDCLYSHLTIVSDHCVQIVMFMWCEHLSVDSWIQLILRCLVFPHHHISPWLYWRQMCFSNDFLRLPFCQLATRSTHSNIIQIWQLEERKLRSMQNKIHICPAMNTAPLPVYSVINGAPIKRRSFVLHKRRN